MIKLLAATLLLFVIIMANEHHPEIKYNDVKLTDVGIMPITLVKLKDTVYHCEEVKETPCGYYLSCGRQSFHCANNIVTEVVND